MSADREPPDAAVGADERSRTVFGRVPSRRLPPAGTSPQPEGSAVPAEEPEGSGAPVEAAPVDAVDTDAVVVLPVEPDDALDEAPDESPDESPDGALDEAPGEAPDGGLDESPGDGLDEAPGEAPDGGLDESPGDGLDEAPGESPDDGLDEAPGESPDGALDEAPGESPDGGLDEAPGDAADGSAAVGPVAAGPGTVGADPTRPAATPGTGDTLVAAEPAGVLRDRWQDAQAGFVDDPRRAVEAAHALVGEAIDEIARRLAGERDAVTAAWRDGGVSTDDLRDAFLRYRQVFERLLAT